MARERGARPTQNNSAVSSKNLPRDPLAPPEKLLAEWRTPRPKIAIGIFHKRGCRDLGAPPSSLHSTRRVIGQARPPFPRAPCLLSNRAFDVPPRSAS